MDGAEAGNAFPFRPGASQLIGPQSLGKKNRLRLFYAREQQGSGNNALRDDVSQVLEPLDA